MPAFGVESKTLRDVMHFSSKHADDVVRGVGGSGKATATFKGELTAENITKELLQTKPKNSPTPQKWMDKGGKIEILEDGTWVYTNSEGITIKYIDGFPDFKEAGLVRQEVEIGEFKNYAIDFKKANMTAPLGKKLRSSTWHHHEDLKTLQEVNKSIHAEFTHRGGVSLKKGK